MKKAALIAAYRQAQAEWLYLLNLLDPAMMVQPLDLSGWTVKDMIAHLTWHEREMVNLARERALVGSPWWELPLDQRNANIYELYKHRTLEGVLSSAEITSDELIQALETLKDEELRDASCFAEMPSDWLPWQVFASNMHEHYHDHIRDLKAWLQKQTGPDF